MLSRLVFIAIVLITAPGNAPASHNPEEEGLRPKDSLPPMAIVQSEDNPKSVIVKFHITSSAVTVQGVTVMYGLTRTYIADPDLFRYELKGFSGEPLARIQTYDPRGIRIYGTVTDTEFQEHYELRSEADAEVIIPFIPKLSSVQFGDSWNHPYGTAYVAREIKTFCADNPSDGECVQWVADLTEDTTPPTLLCGSSDGMWHADDVAIACTASDEGSGLADPQDASFSLSTNVAPHTETANAFTTTRTVCDVANNCLVAGPIGGNKIDKQAPTITMSTPTTGASYTLNQVVAANYDCTDAGAGVATCAGPVVNGAAIDTAAIGPKPFTVNTADNVGNSGLASITYHVIFNFRGFFPPIDNLPTLNAVKAGSAVPVKFSLNGNQGLTIFAAGYPVSQGTVCSSGAVYDIEQTLTAGSSTLSYDASTDQYTYVWKTEKAWVGTCRQLIVTLSDGTEHVAHFKFK